LHKIAFFTVKGKIPSLTEKIDFYYASGVWIKLAFTHITQRSSNSIQCINIQEYKKTKDRMNKKINLIILLIGLWLSSCNAKTVVVVDRVNSVRDLQNVVHAMIRRTRGYTIEPSSQLFTEINTALETFRNDAWVRGRANDIRRAVAAYLQANPQYRIGRCNLQERQRLPAQEHHRRHHQCHQHLLPAQAHLLHHHQCLLHPSRQFIRQGMHQDRKDQFKLCLAKD
jgi:hypothetical protein